MRHYGIDRVSGGMANHGRSYGGLGWEGGGDIPDEELTAPGRGCGAVVLDRNIAGLRIGRGCSRFGL